MRILAGIALAILCHASPIWAQQAMVIDTMDRSVGWEAKASDGVSASASDTGGASDMAGDNARRLDYDFNGKGGYAFLRKQIPIDFPENFALRFKLRGAGDENTLEVKLVDASGENVWWYRREAFMPSDNWQVVRAKRRQIDFAWGPTADQMLKQTASIEFVVTAGKGGKGWISVDQVELVPLPLPPAVPPAPKFESIEQDGKQVIKLDLGYAREFGGVEVDWHGAAPPSYTIALSPDGKDWDIVRTVSGSDGSRDPIRLRESEARYLALSYPKPALARQPDIVIKPLDYGENDNSFLTAIAAEAPRGEWPRSFSGEQGYWTLVGIAQGGETGLLSEDGAYEIGKGKASLEPFVEVDGRLFNWANIAISQHLADGYLPAPGILWQGEGWSLTIDTAAAGRIGHSQSLIRYRLRNESEQIRGITLGIALRPLQVNAPLQFLNGSGGVSNISQLDWDGSQMIADHHSSIAPLTPPDAVVLRRFDEGVTPGALMAAAPGANNITDTEARLASGIMRWSLELAPGETRDIWLAAPLEGLLPSGLNPETASAHREAALSKWREILSPVKLILPKQAQTYADTLKSAVAQMLMSREGAALRPGTRSYARSWIRDGAMMVEGLLRTGQYDAAKAYLDWYAPYLFDNGKIPCCVDARGADPVPENDSNGEFLFLAAEIHRYTHDDGLIARHWPQLQAAAAYLEQLRQSQRTPPYHMPDKAAFYGLLPPSISHEGYSAKPMHSFWDNFWGLRGYKDYAYLAGIMGDIKAAEMAVEQAQEFRHDIIASLELVAKDKGIGWLAGAADLGDFDATSSTIALAPGGEQDNLPPTLLKGTFDRYWNELQARQKPGATWDAYTPYELRNVAAFVRLGQRERAFATFEWLMQGRRPPAWNGWAEVVGREPRKPRFIGDMPHGWIASDYIRSLLDMFAYEDDTALVLAAGIPADWIMAPEGSGISGLHTSYGPLDYQIRRAGNRLKITYRLTAISPPEDGMVFVLPEGLVQGNPRIRTRKTSGSFTVKLKINRK